jgi:YHYH protein
MKVVPRKAAFRLTIAGAIAAIFVMGACGSSTATKPAAPATTTAAAVTTTAASTASTAASTTASTTANSTTTTVAATATTVVAATGSIVNTWSGATVDPAKLPIGDSSVQTSGAGVGKLFACNAGNPNAGGAQADGPWLNIAAGTWDSTTKLKVNGAVSWPTAKYTETVSGGKRVLTTNDLPVDGQTGTFPIAKDDPSYVYDRNPGRIKATDKTVTLAEMGTVAVKVSCMNEGPVGMLRNGVYVFNSLDGRGDDAVAHESQDLCDGHPAMTTYHYHSIPSCIRNATKGPSTVVGFAWDGFPIVVERDANGALPTNADLDECHGRTSRVLLDDKVVTTYNYSATLEFPYFIGCYKGTAVSVGR